jgi:PPOX class probable F420-dependent enzyme
MLDQHPKALARLQDELVIWLTTVNSEGQPQNSAVWFVIDEGDLLVYSSATATRMGNLDHNPKVAVNLRGDPQGDEIVTMEGEARIDPTAPSPKDNASYLEKYAIEIPRLGWNPDSFTELFPAAIRIKIERIRAW